MKTQWMLESLQVVVARQADIPRRATGLTDADRELLAHHSLADLIPKNSIVEEESLGFRLFRDVAVGVISGLATEAILTSIFRDRMLPDRNLSSVEDAKSSSTLESREVTLSVAEEKIFQEAVQQEGSEAVDFSSQAESVVQQLQESYNDQSAISKKLPREVKEALNCGKDELKVAVTDYFHRLYNDQIKKNLRQEIKKVPSVEVSAIRSAAKARVIKTGVTKIFASKNIILAALEFSTGLSEGNSVKSAAQQTAVEVGKGLAIEKFCHVLGSVVGKVLPKVGEVIAHSAPRYFTVLGMLLESTTTGEATLYPPHAKLEEIETIMQRRNL